MSNFSLSEGAINYRITVHLATIKARNLNIINPRLNYNLSL